MRTARWVELLAAHPALTEVLAESSGAHAWSSLCPEARPLLVVAAYLRHPRKTLLVTASHDRALAWQAKLTLLGVPEGSIRQLPSGTSTLFEDAAPETTALSDRIGALRFLVERGPGIVIATASAALERTLPRDILETVFVELKKGDEIEMDRLIDLLATLGYEPAEPVRMPGQYSRRGGILDIYPMGHELPVRVEFFGDDVDGLRQFDANTQRSVAPITTLRLAPSRETLYHFGEGISEEERVESRRGLQEMILRSLEIEQPELGETAAAVQLEEIISSDAKAIAQGVFFDRMDLYRPLIHPDSGCAVDLLPEGGWIVLDEPAELDAIAARAEEELGEAFEARQRRGEILKTLVSDMMLAPDHFGNRDDLQTTALVGFGDAPTWMHKPTIHDLNFASLEPYRGHPEALATTLKTWVTNGFTVTFGTDQPTRAKTVLGQVEIFPQEEIPLELTPGVYIAQGNLAGGFSAPHLKLALVTDQELFGVGRLKLPQRKFNEGAPIATVLDLKPGDYVVHINFGIGIFQGLVKRQIGSLEKECLFIQYAGPDKLYVPADQLDRVQKYLNPGDHDPKINRLHGGEWQKTVGKAREEAREFARDLIRLYASRKQVQRPGFGPDSPWQGEMEATFPWVETPSQVTAIREAKKDLQMNYPMDRLICGDVGFGKTEVAIRVAFKVAQEGRQVAVLCPTTILSEQHYRSFEERLAPFPTRLDILNRFRTTAERKEVVQRLENGEIDLIIGTHALLAQDLKFKDLGLVIIDEEHKFGVKQKEALKALRVSVDVLSMSATPIPRTLSMALMDIRQMSLINDPPPGRLPIRTFVRPYGNEVVREAILRELARGGQIYYVYNRVNGIFHAAERLKKLVPNARIGVGHGQMNEKELEPVMVGFIKGELDILLSTTIIENGLDIPNANTMIVENADRLGLSQLYQLRGRVGRSDRQAYAYLLHQGERSLTENANARLTSLQEFSSLGSGYSLAFRDLQIRGAGDLLGAKQSGTMAAVGYELFTQIIHEEIQFLKAHADGEGKTRAYNDPLEGLAVLPAVDLPVVALIPEHYIEEQAQRLYYYKVMMSARSNEELNECQAELLDRYGQLPAEVGSAFRVMRCRLRAQELGMDKIDGHGGRLAVNFAGTVDVSPRFWSMLQQAYKPAYVSRSQFIWPFTGDALTACETMLKTYQDTWQDLESQRAALGL